ncbi:RICIN domain-containing protein [Kitasatospora sp. NPDC059722]|uniref:RICIN domain-containing protein n=1 Tax=unclassified Kitasatospora TaxID=2633591 RepID=UPI003666DC4A
MNTAATNSKSTRTRQRIAGTGAAAVLKKVKVLAVTAAAVAALGVGTGAAHASTARPAANRCQSVHTYRTGGEYMEVHGWGGKGAVVDTWEYASQNGHIQDNERWCLEPASEGGWYLHPYYNLGLCLDLPSTDEMIVWSCNGRSNQRFSFSNGAPTGGQITPKSDPGLRINGAAHLQLWAQQWNSTDITFWL